MKQSFLMILLVFFILFSNGCAKNTSSVMSEQELLSKCTFILIKGPSQLEVGQKAVFEAVPFDDENNIINCGGSLCPDWSVEHDGIVSVERIDKNKIIIKGISKGNCYIWLNKGNIVTSYTISVK